MKKLDTIYFICIFTTLLSSVENDFIDDRVLERISLNNQNSTNRALEIGKVSVFEGVDCLFLLVHIYVIKFVLWENSLRRRV